MPGDGALFATNTSPSAANVKRKACDSCKTRKVRCLGGNPCEPCLRHGVPCLYTLSHGRVAHLERRVTTLQRRIRLIESAWKAHVPHTQLSVAVHDIENRVHRDDAANELQPVAQVLNNEDDVVLSPAEFKASGGEVAPSPSRQELEQGNTDDLDWDESLGIAAIADGIGSLAVSSKGIGYMGPQSGNALLRSLQSVSILYVGPHDDDGMSPPLRTAISETVLKSSSFSNQCIDWYFQYYHPAYPILHEGYFRAQLMGAISKPKDGSWPVLLHTVQAIGAHSGPLCGQNADIWFCQQASRFLSWDLLQRGTLSIVQALTLLANYLQKRNRPNTGFTLLGAAMTMAQGLGLHRELSGPLMSPFTSEIRRRVWWTLFIFDAGARVTFGRPTMSLGGININEPGNIDDTDLSVDLEELPDSKNEPTVTSSLVWQLKLAKIGSLANEQLLEKRVPSAPIANEIDRKISSWRASLPHYMHEGYNDPEFTRFLVPRMVLLWRSMHLRIVILRPFVLDLVRQRKPITTDHAQPLAKRCIEVADECVSSILAFWNNSLARHGSLIWYACYWLVTAVFVHVTCLLYDPQNVSAMAWRQSIDDAKVAFEAMGEFEPTAYRAAQLLQKVMELVPSSPDSNFFNLNEPIRMEIAQFWNQSWIDLAVPDEQLDTDYT